MTYVLGAAVGILWGAIIGGIKYFALWRGYMNQEHSNAGDNKVLGRLLISNLINVIALLIVFLIRNVIPGSMDWIAMIIATALTISLLGKLYPISKLV